MIFRYYLTLIFAVFAWGMIFSSDANAQSYGNYTYRKKLTLNTTNYISGSSDLSNFTVLLSITDTDLIHNGTSGDKVKSATGNDIAFTDATGDQSSELSYQIESYDAATGTLKAWVKIPTLKKSANNMIYIYFGSTSPNAHPAASSAWTSDYLAVYHFNESAYSTTTGAILDGTGQINATLKSPSNNLTTGFIGTAYSFNGSNQKITSVRALATPNTTLTVSAWVRLSGTGLDQKIVTNQASNGQGFKMGLYSNNKAELEMSGQSNRNTSGGTTLSSGQWYHIQSTYKLSDNNVRTFINGVEDRSGWGGSPSSTGDSIRIGAGEGGNVWYFNGLIDEVRISNVVKSADWMKTEYNNQMFPSNTGTGLSGGSPFISNVASLELLVAGISAPIDLNADANSVAESAANGTLVGITASSTATSGSTVYSLTDNAGGRFAINSSTGVVSVANGSLLNYESSTSHSITIQAADDLTSATQSFTINVTNVIEPLASPADNNSSGNTVAENSSNGATVGITAHAEAESGTTVSYSLSDDAGGRFTINSTTGVVSVANGSLLNYEANRSHSITVVASDGSVSTSQTFSITLTDVTEALTTSVFGTYVYRKQLTLNSTNYVSGSGDLTNFPVLLEIHDTDLIHTGAVTDKVKSATGNDIAFTDATVAQNTATEYNYQIESYDAVNGVLKVWVKIPTLKKSADNTIYMYFGSDNPSTHPAASGTWGSDYKAVYHFNESTYSTSAGAILDGTDQGKNATLTSALNNLTTGFIGSAYSFNGAQKIITTANVATPTSFTLSAWVKPTALGSEQRIMTNYFPYGQGFSDAGRGFRMTIASNRKAESTLDNFTTAADPSNSGTVLNTNTWYYIQTVFSPTQIKTYVNGVLDRQEYANPETAGNVLKIGVGEEGSNYYFNGLIDEVRVAGVARSADWAATEYNNQRYPSNQGTGLSGGYPFIKTYGSLELVNTAPPAPTDINIASNTIAENAGNGTTVGITASSNDLQETSVTYSLTDDAGGRFAINATTGVVTIANSSLLDYETATSHNITIQVSDGVFTASQTFSINVTNIVESLTVINDSNVAANTITENAQAGALVGLTAVAPVESGVSITYSLTDNAGGRFFINPVTGVVKVSSFGFNYETSTSHSITVAATDGATTVHQSFSIAVTDIFDSFSSDYVLQKTITLNNNLLGIGANLTNYPVLLKVQDNNLIPGSGACGNVLSSSSTPDVAFVDPDNSSSELNYEIESYNPTTGTLYVWVKMPTLKAASNNTLYMYFGTATPSIAHTAAFTQATWSNVTGDSKSFKGVWHFKENPASSVLDATSVGNNLSPNGGTVSSNTSSLIGNGISLSSNGALFKTGASNLPATNSTQSISFWAYYTSFSGSTANIVSVQSPGGPNAIQFGPKNGDNITVWQWGGSANLVSASTKPSNAAWHHYTYTFDSSANTSKLYIDGALAGTNTSPSPQGGTPTAISFGAYLNGSNSPGGEYFTGSIDEAQIIDATLSADWIKANYIIQSNPTAFTNNGSVEPIYANLSTLPGALVYTWTGASSTDANDALNWTNTTTGVTGQLPLSSGYTSIVIPTGLSRYPVLSADLSAYGLTIASGASLYLNGYQLGVKCNFYNNGSLYYSSNTNSTLAFNGALATQTYQGNATNAQVGNLTIANTGGNVSITAGDIDIYGLLTVSNNTLNTNGKLTLKASSTQTAGVAAIPNGVSINGNLNVELFLSGGSSSMRGTRSISSPMNEALSGMTTYQQLKNYVIITGPGGDANGFDPGGPINPNAASLTRYYEPATNAQSQFASVNSITEALPAGYGVFLYFRGNRVGYDPLNPTSYNKLVAPFADPEDVVVKYTGVINQGDVLVNLSYTDHSGESNRNGYNLIGNPYPAVIDWNDVNKVNLAENTIIIAKPSGGFAVSNDGVTIPSGMDLRYIQPGMGFYVKANSGASITFKERNKVAPIASPSRLLSTPFNDGFISLSGEPVRAKTSASVSKLLRLSLQDKSYTEEAVIAFGQGYSSTATKEDATFFGGSTVTLSTLSSDNVKLTINRLPLATTRTTIPLSVNALTSGDVKLGFMDLSALENSQLYLVDNYLNKTVQIASTSDVYPFTITKSIAASFGDNRFQLVLSPPTVLPLSLAYFNAKKSDENVKLSWATQSEKGSKEFIIEKSVNGNDFTALTKIKAAGNSSSATSYAFNDVLPVTGLNYYRLTLLDENDNRVYSALANVNYLLEASAALNVYPNPVKDVLNIAYPFDYKTLSIEIIAQDGRVVKQKAFTASEALHIQVADLQSGAYILRLKDAGNAKVQNVQFIKY